MNWSESPPSEGPKSTRSAFISSVQWRDAPISRNYPPGFKNCILVLTGTRVITLQPMSWEIHDLWVQGLGFLLKRTKSRMHVSEQFKMVQEYQVESEEEEDAEVGRVGDIGSPLRCLTGKAQMKVEMERRTPMKSLFGTPRKLAKLFQK